jgi:hypothetical protein
MNRIVRTAVAVIFGAVLLAFCGAGAFAANSYVITNDNNSAANSVSVYKVTGHSLTRLGTVPTGGTGVGAGYYSQVTQAATQDATTGCVFAGDAGSGDIAALKAINSSPYLQVVGNYTSPFGDSGATSGIGVTLSNGYLYAAYDTSFTIGVWQIGSGCVLTFVTHLTTGTVGLNGGPIDGMAATPNGSYLIAAYGDGSVGSYAIGSGTITLVGQETIAGQGVGGGASAAGLAISSNGNWAIFGDLSASNTTQIDVANIGANGMLATTVSYGGNGTLGNGLDSGSVQLSPDNRFIYLADTLSGQETTVSFNATTGVVSYPNACLTNLQGYNTKWLEASQVADVTKMGAGGGIYISEASFGLTADSYIALLKVNPNTGCATEEPGSPFPDPAAPSLQSISSFSN